MAVDPYWDTVSCFLPLNDVTAGIVDIKGNDINLVGNVHIASRLNPFGDYGVSLFDGVGDYVILPASSFLLGDDDFTIESFVNVSDNQPSNDWPYVMASSTFNSGGGFHVYIKGPLTGWGGESIITFAGASDINTGAFNLVSSSLFRLEGWRHIAISRRGQWIGLFVDGVLEDQQNIHSSTYFNSTVAIIGVSNNNRWSGAESMEMSNFRVTKKVGRYYSDFDIPVELYPTSAPTAHNGLFIETPITPCHAAKTGQSKIYGNVTLNPGAAISRQVLLFSIPSMRAIAETYTDSSGDYVFFGVRSGTYIVIARDQITGRYPDVTRVASSIMQRETQ